MLSAKTKKLETNKNNDQEAGKKNSEAWPEFHQLAIWHEPLEGSPARP
jgi:hypothetical protein